MARGQAGVEAMNIDRSGVGEERYGVLCGGCESSERKGMKPLRS